MPSANNKQIGIRSMMLLMLVFSVMSAGFFYASRVGAIQEELSWAAVSQTASNSGSNGRTTHVVFIMFTFTSPLILAGILATAISVIRWKKSKRPQ